jgi:hypothetical protein
MQILRRDDWESWLRKRICGEIIFYHLLLYRIIFPVRLTGSRQNSFIVLLSSEPRFWHTYVEALFHVGNSLSIIFASLSSAWITYDIIQINALSLFGPTYAKHSSPTPEHRILLKQTIYSHHRNLLRPICSAVRLHESTLLFYSIAMVRCSVSIICFVTKRKCTSAELWGAY